jgi:eukaryotic-like serine/threonine-protein kinase
MASTHPSVTFCPLCHDHYDDPIVRFCRTDGARLQPIDQLGSGWVGKIVRDTYRIVRFLGAGGTAEVYEAQHLLLERRVAIKLLLPGVASDPSMLDRFKQEARLISLIGHPNVIAVEDFGILADGTLFMVMELLRGRSFEDELARGAVDAAFALDAMIQVCEGLGAAHDKSIIHRDIKPANIFLHQVDGAGGVPDIAVKLLDLGIAKLQDPRASSNLTVTGTVFGTPEYMSPQQALGEGVDHRSDIYSLGVVVYEALLGQVPFTADSFLGVLTKHLTQTPVWPKLIATQRGLPDQAETVVMKALQKNPDQRYASVRDFQQALVQLRECCEPTAISEPSPRISQVSVRSSRTPTAHVVPLGSCTAGDREAVEIAPDIYWVGRRAGGILECNSYLRVYRGQASQLSVLIDPGPSRDLEVIVAKLSSLIGSVSHVDLMFLNHQDPDLASNASSIQQLNPRCHLLCSEDTWRLVQFYGLRAHSFSAIEHFPDHRMRLATGHPVLFVPTPYCHFRGAVMYYDPATRVLFSGDLFGGLSRCADLVTREQDWTDIDIFHQLYMPSSQALYNAIDQIRRLDPPPVLIAPQHGSIIPDDKIPALLSRIQQLSVGVDLRVKAPEREHYLRALHDLIRALEQILGPAQVTQHLQRFSADGTFPNLFIFGNDRRIVDIKVQPRAAIQAFVRGVLESTSLQQLPLVRSAVNDTLQRHGISLARAPEDASE